MGKAVLLVSLELDEVMSLSDRILVMYEGEIVGQLDPKKTTRIRSWACICPAQSVTTKEAMKREAFRSHSVPKGRHQKGAGVPDLHFGGSAGGRHRRHSGGLLQ